MVRPAAHSALTLVRSFQFLKTQRLEARLELVQRVELVPVGQPDYRHQRCRIRTHPDSGDPRVMQFAVKYHF